MIIVDTLLKCINNLSTIFGEINTKYLR